MAVAPRNAIYVGDLAEQVNETKLMEIFSSVGPITSIRICRDSSTQRSLGYAYINYNRPEHAEAALKSLNFHYIDGRPCRVMYVNRDPWLRKSGKGNIFVKNLPPNTDSVGLRDLFIEFGEIMSVKVPSKDGKWLNYGFVHFKEEKSAQTAIEKKNGVAIDGHKLSVAPFQPKKERSGSITTNLYVKNFPVEDFGDKELQEMFEKYGEISSLKIERNPDTKVSKGFGYVDFKKPGDAKKALELDGTEVQGKKLYVREFQSKEIRKRLLKEKYEKEKQSRWEKFAGTNLFVKNLPEDVDEKKLNEMFSKFGEIKSSVVKMENGVHRGFGFVNFATQEAATKAVTEMNKKLINNKPLYVGLAQSKEERMRKLQDKYNKQHPMVFAGGAPHLMYQQPFPGRPMYMPTGYMVQRGPARMFNGPTQGMGRMPNQIMPGRRGGRKGQNINYKLTANARNHQQAGMMPMPQQIVVQGNPQFQQVQRQPQMMVG
uniref:RRM domain-containing protein n=1 Tax=Lotharella oceanica TaxID=641309 RepID=A0A7S2THB5_9EUKA|mmetsp:Transcript_12373/g.23702  ORF Transcript_12373/g.23702 Transcript_12373/m.23702 type:complete len:486 (+) Transcript_12373:45-1502(+)